MEGKGKKKAFAKAKAESVRCLLNITKYGLYPTVFGATLGELPFPFFYFVLVILSFSVWNIIFFLSFSLILSQFLQSLHLSSTPSVTLGTDLGVATQISILHILLHIPLHVTGSVDFCQIKICTTFNVRMPRETIVAKLSRLFRLI